MEKIVTSDKTGKEPEFVNITTHLMRKMFQDGAATLTIETVMVNKRLVWRAIVRREGDPKVYHLIAQSTLTPRYFKNLQSAFEFHREMVPDAEIFAVRFQPVEEVTTD